MGGVLGWEGVVPSQVPLYLAFQVPPGPLLSLPHPLSKGTRFQAHIFSVITSKQSLSPGSQEEPHFGVPLEFLILFFNSNIQNETSLQTSPHPRSPLAQTLVHPQPYIHPPPVTNQSLCLTVLFLQIITCTLLSSTRPYGPWATHTSKYNTPLQATRVFSPNLSHCCHPPASYRVRSRLLFLPFMALSGTLLCLETSGPTFPNTYLLQ